jgi:hypothetical protein
MTADETEILHKARMWGGKIKAADNQ